MDALGFWGLLLGMRVQLRQLNDQGPESRLLCAKSACIAACASYSPFKHVQMQHEEQSLARC